MRFSLIAAALAAVSAVKLSEPCEPAIDVSQKQLDIELDKFQRGFDKNHYKRAMMIYNEMRAHQGLNPHVRVNTWELYDKAFSFPRVRRYGLVQEHMDLLEHFQDNLNQNFTNNLAVDNFIRVAKAAQAALNAKYSDGEFSDPVNFDPFNAPPVNWSTVKL